MRSSGEENCGQDFGDGEIVFAVAVAGHAALKAGTVAGEERHAVAGVCDVLGGLDGGADGAGGEWSDGAEAGVEEELGGLGVGGFVGSLLRG